MIQLPEFLQSFIAQLILKIQTDSSSDLLKDLNVQLRELEKELATTEANEIAARLLGDSFELGQCFLQTMKDLGNIVAQRGKASFAELMKRWEANITANYPKNFTGLIRTLRFANVFIGAA